MAAVVTLLDVAAEGGGAALLDGRHHAAVRRREGGSDLVPAQNRAAGLTAAPVRFTRGACRRIVRD